MDSVPPPHPSPHDACGSDDETDEKVRLLRSEPRDSMFLLAAVRRPQGADVPVKVRNLSGGGMMAECPGGFVRGDVIHVDLRGLGTVSGKVAWTAAGRLGVQFDEPIDHRLARVPARSAEPQPMLVKPSRSAWRPALR